MPRMSPMNEDRIADLPRFLSEDGCLAMSRLAATLVTAPSASRLSFDVSHCSLWLARRGRDHAEVTVVYCGDRRDGSAGALPSSFEVTFVSTSAVMRGDLEATLTTLAAWTSTLPD